MDIAIIVAILSMIISALTLFMTQLRPPNIKCTIGPTIMSCFGTSESGEEDKDNLRFYIPITFVNTSPRTGSIYKTAITIYKNDLPHERYVMHWDAFWSFHQGASLWGRDEFAHETFVKGNSVEARWASYKWKIMPKLFLKEGKYTLVFHYWESKGGKPKRLVHSFIVDCQIIDALEQVRNGTRNWLVEIVLDKEMEQNRILTEHEYQRLLGF